MIYASIAREVFTRLKFHSTAPLPSTEGGTPLPLLRGLNVKTSGEFRLTGQMNLPEIALIDMTINDRAGKSTGGISMFLRTERKHGWVKETEDGALGAIDWTELVFDALETRPSDGKADQLLVCHRLSGDVLRDPAGSEIPLLLEPFELTSAMEEISDLSFLIQIDLQWEISLGKRASRRRVPFPPGLV